MIYVIVGRRIRALREKKRFTQGELAQATGLTRTSITNLEAGMQRPPLETLYRIAKVFEVEIGALIPKVAVIDQAEKVIRIPAGMRLTNSKKPVKVSQKTTR
jgi:transcriptional regulator with XRE-family HTH domain